MASLDGGRERKIVALGATALLIVLSVGPSVTHALAQTVANRLSAKPEIAADVPTIVKVIEAPMIEVASSTEAAADTEGSADADETIASAAPAVPPLSFLFPSAGAVSDGPTSIAVRLENATAVAMLFEVTDANGYAVRTLPALPALTGEWSALLSAGPGDYSVGVRASLADGRVIAFKERRAFRILSAEPAAPPADPTAPVVELTSSASADASSDGVAPLNAKVKNGAADALVFLVTAEDGGETLVIGMESAIEGYWSAMFEGPDGEYRVRARAMTGDQEILSAERTFTLRKK